MVMPPVIPRLLFPVLLQLLVAGLLVLRQDVLETGLKLLVLLDQPFPLLLQPFPPGLSFRTVPLFEGRAGGLHAGPEAVAAGFGGGHVALITLGILLQALATQLDGISQDGRRGGAVQGSRTLHMVMRRMRMVASGVGATLGLGHSG